MNKQEFEKRVGLIISGEEYAAIEPSYMALPSSVNKDTFCRQWVENGGIQNLFDRRAEDLAIEKMKNRDLLEQLGELTREIKWLETRRRTLESAVIEKARSLNELARQ
ncbi:MAG: hypothetical protein LBJ35_08195 [Spirochaetaceae bacterium]|jgi:hypothetical protein|nr:hypothetical protein [Spirochaetaceae bacterium]